MSLTPEQIKQRQKEVSERIREANKELESLISDAHTLRGFIATHGRTPSMVLSERDRLVDTLDLMRDEFQRIKALLPGAEIEALCDRAVSGIEQSVPVILQRDFLEKERDRLDEELALLRKAYVAMARERNALEKAAPHHPQEPQK